MLAFMGEILGQGMRLKARCPDLAYANVCLYFFSLIAFIHLAFWVKDMGGVVWFVLFGVVCFAR